MGKRQACLFCMLALSIDLSTSHNLALNKPTWQSSTYSNYSSDKAVDGKVNLRMALGGQCAISDGDFQEVTWMVDLGEVYAVHSIFIYFRIEHSTLAKNNIKRRLLGFSVYASNTTRMMDGMLCYHDNNNTIESMRFQVIVNCIVQARYIIYYNSRFRAFPHSPQYSTFANLDLCEVEVYGCGTFGLYGTLCNQHCPRNCQHCHIITGECLGRCSPGYYGHRCIFYDRENMALFRHTDAKYAYSNTIGSEKVVDGKKTKLSYGGGECFFSRNQQAFAFFYVDLVYIRGIERVIVYHRQEQDPWDNYYAGRFLGFSIIVSNTTDLRDGVVCFKETTHNQSTIPPVFDVDCHVTGRYVFYYNDRFFFDRPEGYSQYAHADICEIEVYGCPFADYNGPGCSLPCYHLCRERYLENLAFRKPTWLSNPWGGYTSENAVDGYKDDRHYASGPCTVSDDKQIVTWRVDLQEIKKIEYIKIYFRTDNRPFDRNNLLAGFPLGFSVYISNTTNKNDGILCFHDTKYTRDTIPETAIIPCIHYCRYVIYYNERLPGRTYPSDYYQYARADLCEVEVYGCPVPVENLPTCYNHCPKNCECHEGTGACRRCLDGYEGENCEREKVPFLKHCG